MYYIGLDIHKKTISYCVKDVAGYVHREGKIGSIRRELDAWIGTLPQPRMMAMESTIFTGWIHDYLLPHAEKVKVAHPLMLRAIAAAKKKNDRIDASKIADCLRCDFLPECHMASTEIRDRRRVLRYRNLVVKQMVQMKNRVSGLLLETGVSYNKQRLHKVGYFGELMSTNPEISDAVRPLLNLSRGMIRPSGKLEYDLVSSLERDSLLKERAAAPAHCAWSWFDYRAHLGSGDRRLHALQFQQAGDQLLRSVRRREKFGRQGDADAALETAQQAHPESADRSGQAGPRESPELAMIRARELERGNPNRATLAVARKMVCYMLAVERRQQDFVPAAAA